MNHVQAERFALLNEIEVDEVIDFFRGVDFDDEEE